MVYSVQIGVQAMGRRPRSSAAVQVRRGDAAPGARQDDHGACREHQLKDSWSTVARRITGPWANVYGRDADTDAADQVRIAELERMVGRLAMELEVSKKRPAC